MPYNSYVPARKAHIRKLIERENLNIYNDSNLSCECPQPEKIIENNQGYVESTISNNMRISQIISSNLGGRITFGNLNNNNNSFVSYLGGIEGQPGGVPRPLRNKF
jgi:hypothetical protein